MKNQERVGSVEYDSSQYDAVNLCVLFADIVGSTRLYEQLGDEEASRIVKACLEEMKAATHTHHGSVINTMGDEILSTFRTCEQAALAGEAMMRRVERLPLVCGNPITLRIGFHVGPVVEVVGNIFGDTVNTAARIVALARARQIFASKAAVERLPNFLRIATRELAAFSLKGKQLEMAICEFLWEQEHTDLTVQLSRRTDMGGGRQKLVLALGAERLFVYDPETGPVTLGRGGENTIVIDNPRISRRHARIELRRDKYVLTDTSTNGTWVRLDGESEVVLRHEEFALHGRGLISLGHPLDQADRQGTLGFALE